MLIKKDIPQRLFEGLVEHTKRLRTFKEAAIFIDLQDQCFLGPKNRKSPYASFCILDPVITVEKHDGNLHIAARFNLETTILRYSSHKRLDI